MDEAEELLTKENLQKEEDILDQNQQKIKLAEQCIAQFHLCLPHLPVIQEILFEHHKVVFDHYPEKMEYIINTKNGYGVFGWIGAGFEYDNRLIQSTDIDQDNVISDAWAILFEDVFGREVYIMPYKKYRLPKNGLAIRVISQKENRFFPHDIPREFAIKWLADYKRKQK